MDETPMQRIGELELLRLVGRGGSASVYEAVDRRHARRVAVKVLDRRGVEERSRRAFRRELQAMGRLGDHPYVLDVFASGFTEDGAPYLVMPLVSAGTLADRLGDESEVSITQVLDYGVKIAAALETAHRRGILHCDIKPSNIFIGPFADPMLGDMGISSVADSSVTTTNRVSLTLMYAAPEIVLDNPHTVASDIYSLGATLFAMIEGRPPYSGDSMAAVATKIVSATEPPTLQRPVPAGLRELIAEMMAIAPDDRPGSAAEVIERLQAIQHAMDLVATSAPIGDVIDADDSDGASLAGAVVARDDETDLDTMAGARAAVPGAVRARRGNGAGREDTRRRGGWPLAIAAGVIGLLAAGAIALFALNSGESTSIVQGGEQPADEVPTAEPLAATTEPGAPEPDSDPESAQDEDPQGSSNEADQAGTSGESDATDESDEADEVAGITIEASPEPTEVSATEPEAESEIDADPDDDAEEDAEEPDEEPTVLTIVGQITAPDGTDVTGTGVERFSAAADGSRGDFFEGVLVGADGTYAFAAPPGCYVLTFVAPEGTEIAGASGKFKNVPVCVDSFDTVVQLDGAIQTARIADATLSGIVSSRPLGFGESGVKVDVFVADGPGARGAFVGAGETDTLGNFAIDVPAGCYILTYVAPDGRSMVGGDRFLNSDTLCVERGGTASTTAEVE